MRRLAALALAATVVAGCGAAPTPVVIHVTPEPTIAPTPTPTPSVHTLTGTVHLWDASGEGIEFSEDPQTCRGQGGYGDIGPGAQVIVRDGAGQVVAIGALDSGWWEARLACWFPFAVNGIPDAAFYQIEVSHRGAVTYSRGDLAAVGWRVELTIGE